MLNLQRKTIPSGGESNYTNTVDPLLSFTSIGIVAALCKTMQVRTDAAIYACFNSTKSSKTELHPPLTYIMSSARASNTLTLWHVSLENPGFLLLRLQRRQNITKSKRDGKKRHFSQCNLLELTHQAKTQSTWHRPSPSPLMQHPPGSSGRHRRLCHKHTREHSFIKVATLASVSAQKHRPLANTRCKVDARAPVKAVICNL